MTSKIKKEMTFMTKDFRRYTLKKVYTEKGRFMSKDFKRYTLKRVWL